MVGQFRPTLVSEQKRTLKLGWRAKCDSSRPKKADFRLSISILSGTIHLTSLLAFPAYIRPRGGHTDNYNKPDAKLLKAVQLCAKCSKMNT